MRSTLRPAPALAWTVAAAALALVGGHPAAAQDVVSDTKADPVAAIRLGIHIPFNSRIKNQLGTVIPGGGLDYAVQHSATNRTIVSLDYIERSKNGSNLRFYPLTIGQMRYADSVSGVRPYTGYGLGAYFVHSDLRTDSGGTEVKNGTAFGGYIAGGLDFADGLFLEARYHQISEIGLAKPSGLQVTVGYRF